MSKNKIGLSDLQKWMRWIITDPRGVPEALSGAAAPTTKFRSRYIEPLPSARTKIDAKNQNELEARLNIYAEAYFARILESMENDFPKTRKIVGEASFSKLIADYLKAYPSMTTNIGEVGRNFASFISEYEELAERDELAEIINFEWKTIECFYAVDEQGFEREKLSRVADEEWAHLLIKFNASLKIFETKLPLDLIWALEEQGTLPELITNSEAKSYFLWRQNGTVQFRQSESIELQLMKGFMQGLTLSEVLDRATTSIHESPEVLSSNLMKVFSNWVFEEILIDVLMKT